MSKPLRAVLYARVSTDDGRQDVQTQLQALKELCAVRQFPVVAEHSDRVTGDPARRDGDPPGLRAALALLAERRADVLVIFAADRLVRSPTHLLQLIERIQSYGAKITSYTDGRDLDTTTPEGELNAFLLGWMSRMSVRLTRERTIAGLKRTRAQGTVLGRPRVQLTEAQRDEVIQRLGLEQSVRQIAREMELTRYQVELVQGWLKNGGPRSAPASDGAGEVEGDG